MFNVSYCKFKINILIIMKTGWNDCDIFMTG